MTKQDLFNNFHYQICNDCGISESDSTELAAINCVTIAQEYAASLPSARWVKAETPPKEKGFYTVRGLNNQANHVTHEGKDPIWFTGERWIIREGCQVTEWLDESALSESPANPQEPTQEAGLKDALADIYIQLCGEPSEEKISIAREMLKRQLEPDRKPLQDWEGWKLWLNDKVNSILRVVMMRLNEEQKIALRDALIERTPPVGSGEVGDAVEFAEWIKNNRYVSAGVRHWICQIDEDSISAPEIYTTKQLYTLFKSK